MRLGETPYNELNSKEVHAVPPMNLDVTGCEKPTQSDEKLPSYALRLIRRLLTIVDADFTNISFQDREWLEDVLNGTSLSKIARSANVSVSSVRYHVLSALELLSQKVEDWEKSQKEHSEMAAREKSIYSETKDIKVNPVVSRLIWSLLDAVFSNDDEDDALSYKDKMLLEDILRFGTIAEVARQRGAKSNILTYEFNQSLSRLRTKIDTIEKYTAQLKQQRDGSQIIPTKNPKIEQLREENFDLKAKIAVLEHCPSQLKAELKDLQSELAAKNAELESLRKEITHLKKKQIITK